MLRSIVLFICSKTILVVYINVHLCTFIVIRIQIILEGPFSRFVGEKVPPIFRRKELNVGVFVMLLGISALVFVPVYLLIQNHRRDWIGLWRGKLYKSQKATKACVGTPNYLLTVKSFHLLLRKAVIK